MRTITLIREPDVADERVKEAFRDVKDSLRVSFVDALFQAYAADPKFIDHVWRRLRPSMLAPPFVAAAAAVAEIADREVETWPVSDHAAALHSRNYADNDLRKLREIVELFHCMNPKLLIIAHAVRVALTGEPIGGGGVPPAQAHVDRDKLVRDFRGVRVPLSDEREAPLRVRMTYEEIQRSTGLPFVDTDLRAMGAYPDWLDVFWTDNKPLLSSRRRQDLCAKIEGAAQIAARQLPYPLYVKADAFPEMVEVNDAFCGLLPGVVADIAVARRGLGPEPRNP
jgi:hypothetical protein